MPALNGGNVARGRSICLPQELFPASSLSRQYSLPQGSAPVSQPDIAFDRYYTHAEMTERLQALVAAHPHLASMRSVAKSFQGRDVWLVEISNPKTGPAAEKPGYYIDAQIHAEEHATSATALYAIWHLLTRYGSDAEVTRLVDQQVFYILPRINPDGAELSLLPPYYNWCGNGRF